MNLALVDPFVLAVDIPEEPVGQLRSGQSSCIRFSPRGDYLASGRRDGTVVILDLETNGVAMKMRGHTTQVQSVSWSKSGRYLLSASQDCKCILWDLHDGTKVRSVRFEAPIFIAEQHPDNHLIFVAALFEQQPVLVDATSEIPIKYTLPSVPKRSPAQIEKLSEAQIRQDEKATTTVAVWHPSGRYIFAGTSKGWLNIIDVSTRSIVHSTKLSANLIIFLRLTSSGRDMVVNSSDRIIRTLKLPDLTSPRLDFNTLTLETEHKFQDLISHHSWNHVCMSHIGEHVIASTFNNLEVFVWSRLSGTLVRILEGPKEELSVVEWHPHRPFIAAVGAETGPIFMWGINAPQRWSALAPDFHEVEENVEYVEREDEFDIHPLDELDKRRLDMEDEEVDVLTLDPVKGGPREEEEEQGFKMPVLLDLEASDSDEEVAVGAGQYRRKSPGRERDVLGENGVEKKGAKRRRGE